MVGNDPSGSPKDAWLVCERIEIGATESVEDFIRQVALELTRLERRALVSLHQSQAPGVKVEGLSPTWLRTNECCMSVSYYYFSEKQR